MIYVTLTKHLPYDTEYVDAKLKQVYEKASENGVDVKVIDYEVKIFNTGIIDYNQEYFEKYEYYLLNKLIKYGKKYKGKDLYLIIKGCNIHPQSEELILKILNLSSTPEVNISYVLSNTRRISEIQNIRDRISFGLDSRHLVNFDNLYNNYYQGNIQENYPLEFINPELPKAIIVDIDGTIIFIKDRDYWDMESSLNDYRIEPTIEMVKQYFNMGYKVLFVTSRREMFRDTTEKLIKDIFPNQKDYLLFMRGDTDLASHSIYKREVYKNHIMKNYCVHFALEDNSSVVDAYRNLGILTLQTINNF